MSASYGGSATPAAAGDTSSTSSSIITLIIIVASAIIVSVSIYLLLRYRSRRLRLAAAATNIVMRSDAPRRRVESRDELVGSLPLFTFGSITPSIGAGGDCAVCLSRFEPHDQLRLLPLCCHAFHASCIDTWIVSNQTCPLCRSIVLPSGADALHKILLSSDNHRRKNSHNNSREINGDDNGNGSGDMSFRIEIGNVSRRRDGEEAADAPPGRSSYSLGSFDYIVNGNGYEVLVGCTTHSRRFSEEAPSVVGITTPPGEALAAEVSGGRNMLRECVDRLASVSSSSRTMSFRSSSSFFSGSSRRNESVVVAAEDLEAYRAGEEISEIFRWVSGV